MKQRAASILEEMAHSRPPVQLLLLIICLLSFVHSETVPKVLSSKDARDAAYAREMASRHFHAYGGVKHPSDTFAKAVGLASYEVEAPQQLASTRTCRGTGVDGRPLRRRVVLMAMANDLALNLTVPTFLGSLQNISVPGGGTLADHLVLACSSESSVESCRQLGLGDRCVYDPDAPLGSSSLAFHTLGFNMIGFGKIKYILNALSLDYDVIFLDTDIVAFKNFVPHVLSLGADIASTIEKCRAFDDKINLHAKSIPHDAKGVVIPTFNIGVTYFRATPAVLRCVHAWMFDMWVEVEFRPHLWDQDLFKKVVTRCTLYNNVSLHALSPRMFNSACFKPCGCAYTDETMISKPGSFLYTVKMPKGSDVCPVEVMKKWVLMHFPCSGKTENKVLSMRNFLNIYHTHVG